MSSYKRYLLILVSIIILIGCDSGTKNIARNELMGKPVTILFGGNLKLFYAENPGGMLSFGSDIHEGWRFIVFQIFVGGLLAFLLWYFITRKELDILQTTGYVLIISGGLGNLIDRIINNGNVIDFIILEFNSLHTGIFNVADFYITIGVLIMLFSSFFNKKVSRESKIQNEQYTED